MNKNLKQIAVPLVSVLLVSVGAIIMGLQYDALWGYGAKKAFGSIKS